VAEPDFGHFIATLLTNYMRLVPNLSHSLITSLYLHRLRSSHFMSTSIPSPSGLPIAPLYVDVHAHIIHEQFLGEEDAIAMKSKDAGLEYVVVNEFVIN